MVNEKEEGVPIRGTYSRGAGTGGSGGGSWVMESFREGSKALVAILDDIEGAALHRASQDPKIIESNRSVLSARLGGHITSSARLKRQDVVDEKTGLLVSQKDIVEPLQAQPPLSKWIGIALLCALAYALYNIFIKKGSASIHPILGGVILQFVAALLGLVLLLCIICRHGASEAIDYNKWGILWSVGAGIWVGLAEMLSFDVSSLGVDATQSIPIIIGGSVLFGSLLGLILLGEHMMFQGWGGVALLTAGIAMVATDPGEKVEEGGGGDEASEVGPPPLIQWIGPALFCALSYALYNICIKKGSASINPVLGGVVLQFVAALFGSCLLAILEIEDGGEGLKYDTEGIMWACFAGISVGTAELLSFSVSGMGVDASKSIPILIGGSVMFGAVLGIIMLGEQLMFQGWSGVVGLMVGIALVATDPGEKMEGH